MAKSAPRWLHCQQGMGQQQCVHVFYGLRRKAQNFALQGGGRGIGGFSQQGQHLLHRSKTSVGIVTGQGDFFRGGFQAET